MQINILRRNSKQKHHQVFEVHSKRTAALAGSFDMPDCLPACLPYTIASIYLNNPHNISACFC